MSTNILALNGTVKGKVAEPNFKGWTPSTINLYYALVSRGNLDKDNGYIYINKSVTKEDTSIPGRYWNGWGELGECFGIAKNSLSRARKSLSSLEDPYCYGASPILTEDNQYIYLINIGNVAQFNQFIDHSVMTALIAYAAKHQGNCFIMRVYSMLQMAAKLKEKLSITQMVAACGKYEAQAMDSTNKWREELRNCLTFLMAFGLVELRDSMVMHGKKMCCVFYPTKFPPCSADDLKRIKGFLENGALSQEELDKIKKFLV